jgi:PEP-CTERM motif
MVRSSLIGAALLVAYATSGNATTHVYDLNGSFADSLGGNSLVGLGGALGPTGYSFGPNQGLSLDLTGIVSDAGPYTIEIDFSFTDTSGYRKILDFDNLAADAGLYNLSTDVNVFNAAFSPSGVIEDNILADLIISRTAAGHVTVSVDGKHYLGFDDTTNITKFGAGNIANFFVDDNVTGQREASGGFVDFIKISDTASVTPGVPEPSTWVMMLLGFAGLGYAGFRQPRSAISIA